MPVVFKEQNSQGAIVAVWEISETESGLKSLLQCTAEMDNRLNRISHPGKRLEWLASRVLLQNLSNSPGCVFYNANGKPFLNQSSLAVSISHTKGYAAVVVSPNQPCGIDIEYPSDRVTKLSSRFVHPEETKFIDAKNIGVYHSLIWCAKETLYKMVDSPGLVFKDDLQVKQFLPENEGSLEASVLLKSEIKIYNLNYRVGAGYYLVWHW